MPCCRALRTWCCFMAVGATLFVSGPAALADLEVDLNTAQFVPSGTSGYLAVELVANDASSPPVTATVTVDTSQTDAAFNSFIIPINATGDFSTSPDSATLDTTMGNSFFIQGLTFGSQITFDIAFTGSASSADDGNLFSISLYDPNFNQIATSDPNGSVVSLPVNADGTNSPIEYFASPMASVVPEPSTAGPALVAIATILAVARRRSRARRGGRSSDPEDSGEDGTSGPHGILT